jgi:hypothetical protein
MINNLISRLYCKGQFFGQKCHSCGYLLRIWCTEWKACPKCGSKNHGKHFGAK